MVVTKELVLTLYERKDPKRKRMLFELFPDLLTSGMSARYVAEVINAELAAKIVTLYDIKYIRAKMKRWIDKPLFHRSRPPVISETVPAKNQKWPLAEEPEPYVKISKKFNS